MSLASLRATSDCQCSKRGHWKASFGSSISLLLDSDEHMMGREIIITARRERPLPSVPFCPPPCPACLSHTHTGFVFTESAPPTFTCLFWTLSPDRRQAFWGRPPLVMWSSRGSGGQRRWARSWAGSWRCRRRRWQTLWCRQSSYRNLGIRKKSFFIVFWFLYFDHQYDCEIVCSFSKWNFKCIVNNYLYCQDACSWH